MSTIAAKPTPEAAVFGFYLPVLYRDRHADRRHHLRLPDGLLACLVGVLVTLQAYVYPFTMMVLK